MGGPCRAFFFKMGLLSVLDVVTKPRNTLLSLAIITSVAVAVLASIQDDPAMDPVEQLPFCGEENERTIGRRLLYIATLDGKLTALDVSKDGHERWNLPTGPGPLISSSIHKLELTNNGQMVRMIPSLSGGIYKFDGQTIDPIPITAENLLSSSFKFSDDLIISGGKETRSYGVSVRTGQVLYECNMQGCHNFTESVAVDGHDRMGVHDPLLDDVMVVRRQTQTVRAVEPRTGSERWNFSVGHHELELLKSTECHDRPRSNFDMAMIDLEVKVMVPDGIVCAFSRSTNAMLWKHQFDSPIVSVWQTDPNDVLRPIDIFNSAQWVWTSNQGENPGNGIAPSIYLGMFRKQLYIQESSRMHKLVADQSHEFAYHLVSPVDSNALSIPWRPIPATSSALALIDEDSSVLPKEEKSPDNQDEENTSVTALSVLYASEYVNGNGFYLYTTSDLNKTRALCDSNASAPSDEGFEFVYTDDDSPLTITVIMTHWWRVGIISLALAMAINFCLLYPKLRPEREFVVIERHIPVPTGIEATEENISGSNNSARTLSESGSNNSETFTSRFQTDFDFIQCLGKGGFGVVFEAKNKLDDCNYAVKRITLPNKKESRDRVMREVKTLANCEHQNIVRYFQAWVENPPPGWQEMEDEKWMQRDVLSTSIDIETPDGTTLPKYPSESKSVFSKDKCRDPWISNADDQSKELSSWFANMNNNKYTSDNDSSSFIQFKEVSKAQEENSIAIDVHSRRTSQNSFKDESDSFEIEFKHSSRGLDQKSRNDTNYTVSKSFIRGHKRPKSLDLASNGQALVAVQPKIQNKVYLYIQMQLCRKQSLRDWLRENRTETRQPHIKNIFGQIVDAVDYVHQKGLIHRDLKPSNIFFSLDGQIKIGDFGLVTDTSDAPNSLTSSGDNAGPSQAKHTQQVGTHLYMSPEQLEGRPYDFKVDIYSLGLIFFELIKYFDTEMERIITLKGIRDGKYPSDFRDVFPQEFDLLQLMLAMMPQKRPSTFQIKEMLSDITSWKRSPEITDSVPKWDAPNGITRWLEEMSGKSKQ